MFQVILPTIGCCRIVRMETGISGNFVVTGSEVPKLYTVYHNVLRWPFFGMSVIGIAINAIAFMALIFSKKISRTIRIICTQIVVSETVVLINNVIYEISSGNTVLQTQIYRFDKLIMFMLWTSTTILSLELVFVLEAPRLHMKYFSKNKLKFFYVGFWFLIACVIIIFSFKTFNPNCMTIVCWLGTPFIILYSIIITCANFRIWVLCRRQLMKSCVYLAGKSTMNIKTPIMSKSTKVLVLSAIGFLSMNVPVTIEKIESSCSMSPRRAYTFYLVVFNCALNPFIYVFRFRECQLIVWKRLLQIVKLNYIEKRVHELRSDVHYMSRRSLVKTIVAK